MEEGSKSDEKQNIRSSSARTSNEGTPADSPSRSNGAFENGNMGYGGFGLGGMGMGMGMGGYGLGMGGYGMGLGGYGMGVDGFMGPLMNQLMIVQSLNYTLMSFGHIVQTLGINANSILQFGKNILHTLDALAVAIKKSGILHSNSEDRSVSTLSQHQKKKLQLLRGRRRAVLLRWTLVILTMAVTSQIMRILRHLNNSSLFQHVVHFFKSFSSGIIFRESIPTENLIAVIPRDFDAKN